MIDHTLVCRPLGVWAVVLSRLVACWLFARHDPMKAVLTLLPVGIPTISAVSHISAILDRQTVLNPIHNASRSTRVHHPHSTRTDQPSGHLFRMYVLELHQMSPESSTAAIPLLLLYHHSAAATVVCPHCH
ncbi:hypothetical protein EDD86DRAFT_76233 [Gorgonomyces haynaldii]|nr:hypothetical protein EDD86DRAFT_76233 [Gorgonomyces haynaldii]